MAVSGIGEESNVLTEKYVCMGVYACNINNQIVEHVDFHILSIPRPWNSSSPFTLNLAKKVYTLDY